ncbi:hypothetical protein [Sneathiella glossodoripedis]|uniref:hypothetical protein n=1 Tax=Sneathiella glossodoripedis TaxID=418853 RepID=UPI00046FBAFB|nr:hypothetical protein [Sneathiella glossodoripedis]
MISSLNKLLTAGLLFPVILSLEVVAQEKPRSLVPSFIESQSDQPLQTKTPDNAVPAEKREPATDLFKTPAKENTGDLQIQSLGALHPASIDVHQDVSDALGGNLWDGLQGELVLDLLEKIEAPVQSPSLMNIYTRLLFSGSTIPDASAVGDRILKLRINRLVENGFFNAAARYFDRLPSTAYDDELRALKARLMLLDGREKAACDDGEITRVQSVVGFWAKLDVFCRLTKGEYVKAELGAALYEESGNNDPLFQTLVAVLIGSPIELPENNQPLDAVHFALLKLVGGDFPDWALRSATPAVVAALARQVSKVKAGGAELLLHELSYGRDVELEQMLAISDRPVSRVPVPPKSKDEPSSQEPLDAKPDYAEILKVIAQSPLAEDKANGLLSLWTAAANAGDYFAVSRLSLSILEALPVGPYGQEFNRHAIGILLLNDRSDLSRQWERIARRAAIQGTPEERLAARKDILRLDTIILLAGIDGIARWNAASFENWLRLMEGDQSIGRKGTFLLTIMEVLGYSVSEADWDRLLSVAHKNALSYSNHAFENALIMAATKRQKGKTIALSLLATGTVDMTEVSLTTLRAVTTALIAIGREADARKLALEAAILMDL